MIVYQFHCFESFFKYTYKKGKTCVIPNMIYYPKDDITKRAIINNDNLRFAAISTLYSVKRINMMIDIFANVWSKHPTIVLNIYGDGPDREKLEQQVCKLGLQNSIIFHGHVTDTTKVLCNNDVLLMTSEREGFPNVILEAMNVGAPTVMFKCHDGLSEIITDGVNGFLIEPDNTNEFTEKLQSLVVNPNIIKELSKNALSSKAQYSREQVMHLWENCIKFTIRSNSR